MTQTQLFNVTLATRLTTIRAARDLRQADVAEATGIDKALISRYENGLSPTPENLVKLQEFFGIEFDNPQVDEAIRVLAGKEQPIAA